MEKKQTDSGIEIKSVYTATDLHQIFPELPGQFPFTRGVQPDMYRGKLWTMRQYAGFSTAEESNKRYQYLLSQGVMGLSVAFDLPTQIGYDSDHSLADGEVGKVGVAIDTIDDMRTLFKGIKLEDVTTSMTINATGYILLALYVALAKEQGADLKKIGGTIQNDILKEYAARGTYIYPPKPSMRIITDIFEWCSKELPKWNTISISGYHIREAGSTAAQEIAFTLSNGKAYVLAALNKGLDIDVFGKRLSFFFNAHNNLFEEVAKFRAARRMWAKIMKDLGAKDLESGVTDTADPLAGSYFIENLTNEMEQKANEIMQQIETMGGSVEAIEAGWMQEQIARSAYQYQKGIETKDRIIVGLNAYSTSESDSIPVFKIDSAIQQEQITRLTAFKSSRDLQSVQRYLSIVNDHAVSGQNLMPSVIEAIENNCSLGEIADVLRSVFGEHR